MENLNRKLLPTLRKIIDKEVTKKDKIVGERIKLINNLDTQTVIAVTKLSY